MVKNETPASASAARLSDASVRGGTDNARSNATSNLFENAFSLGPLLERLTPRGDRETRLRLRRPDDLLVLDLRFDNLRVQPETGEARGPSLVRDNAARDGVLIVEFPPQSFGEEAFLAQESALDGVIGAEIPNPTGATANKQAVQLPPTAESLVGRLPARVRMAGASRIAFTMPADVAELPLSADAVLSAMQTWPMRLDANARVDEAEGLYFALVPSEFHGRALRSALLAAVDVDVAGPLDHALRLGARRVAEQAAGGLGLAHCGEAHEVNAAGQANAAGQGSAAGQACAVGLVTWHGIRREADAVSALHPALREGDLHTAVLGLLALDAALQLNHLSMAQRSRSDGLQAVATLPYLPLLIGRPHPPSRQLTALELPYRLLISPIVGAARWQHRLTPAQHRGRTELWHTRLGEPPPDDGLQDGPARIRALWSPDFDRYDKASLGRPFRMSLDAQDRDFLVKLMADWTQYRPASSRKYLPQSSAAQRLHLSSLGALLDAAGDWDPRPDGVDLSQWRHQATLGRDHYVRVVYAGFLWPFGHAASLVKVTERQFEWVGSQRTAVLRQRFFIVVREPVRSYDGSRHVHGGRNFPFVEVEILTQVTPNLADPAESAEGALGESLEIGGKTIEITERMLFWPRVGGADFRFEVTATDRDGRRISFSLPMLFASEVLNLHRAVDVRTAYNADDGNQFAAVQRREASLGGASLRFDAQPGDSVLNTRSLRFRAGDTGRVAADVANVHPELDQAEVCVPALQKLLGRDEPIAMTYPDQVVHALPNAGQVFLRVVQTPYELVFGGGGGGGGGGGAAQTDALGGLAAPQSAIYGLSKLSGPVSGRAGQAPAAALAKAIARQFDPKDFFPDSATLIGGIVLNQLLPAGVALDGADAPRLRSTETPDATTVVFEWDTPVTQSDALKLLIPNAGGNTRLAMMGKTVVPTGNPGASTREAQATLNHFKLDLFGCVIVWFDQLRFEARPGQKPDVVVQLHEGVDAVQFGGPLEFVNDLRKFIPSNGFSDPPSLSVTPSGISAGYALSLPSIGVGIFTLSNVSLGAGFSLPFDNRPVSVRFNFAERQRPFSLTVSMLGGGGFFAIAVGAKGVQEIEAALEFGAAIALNLVVASGSVEIKAGVYFNWKDDGVSPKRVVLAGYVRIHGELCVLAIFSASLTFNLQLAYEKSGSTSIVYGEAELIVEVEVLFLSFDVAVRCRREFGGGEADPKFLDLVPHAGVWDAYCAAFAPEVA